MHRLGRFFQGARFLGGGRGDRGNLSLCASVWRRLLLSPASSGEMMLTWLFPSTWGFINPLCAFLLVLLALCSVIFLPAYSMFGGWCFHGGCSTSPVSLGLAAVQPCPSCRPLSLPAPPVFLLQEPRTLPAAACSAGGVSSGCARANVWVQTAREAVGTGWRRWGAQPLCSLWQPGCLQVQCRDGKAAGIGSMSALLPPWLLWGWMDAATLCLWGPVAVGSWS